jgi:hypothetical protein
MKTHKKVKTPSVDVDYCLLLLSLATARIQLSEKIQKKVNKTFVMTFKMGAIKIPNFSVRNCEATLMRMIPRSIFFLRQ